MSNQQRSFVYFSIHASYLADRGGSRRRNNTRIKRLNILSVSEESLLWSDPRKWSYQQHRGCFSSRGEKDDDKQGEAEKKVHSLMLSSHCLRDWLSYHFFFFGCSVVSLSQDLLHFTPGLKTLSFLLCLSFSSLLSPCNHTRALVLSHSLSISLDVLMCLQS